MKLLVQVEFVQVVFVPAVLFVNVEFGRWCQVTSQGGNDSRPPGRRCARTLGKARRLKDSVVRDIVVVREENYTQQLCEVYPFSTLIIPEG